MKPCISTVIPISRCGRVHSYSWDQKEGLTTIKLERMTDVNVFIPPELYAGLYWTITEKQCGLS
jgi:hypothetical protein